MSAAPSVSRLVRLLWPPMLATAARSPAELGEGYTLELKYDGFRAVLGSLDGQLELTSRNGKDLGRRFSGLKRGLGELRLGDVVLDGELVAVDGDGYPRFGLMGGPGEHRFVAFDVLWLRGEDLRALELEARRERLQRLVRRRGLPLELAQRIELPVAEAMAGLRRLGLEGIVAKRRGSRYVPGRSRAWLKLKVRQREMFAVLGYLRGPRGGLAALLVGEADGAGWRATGLVEVGFREGERGDLRVLLEAARQREPRCSGWRGAVWVRPGLQAQVSYAERTPRGLLRQPAFEGVGLGRVPGTGDGGMSECY